MITRVQETKAVKAALTAKGFEGVKVGHGTGTAYGWLHIHTNKRYDDYSRTDREVEAIAQEVTGGCITVEIHQQEAIQ